MPAGQTVKLLRFPDRAAEASPHAEYRRAIVAAVAKLGEITDSTASDMADELVRVNSRVLGIVSATGPRAGALSATINSIDSAVSDWRRTAEERLALGMEEGVEAARALTGAWTKSVDIDALSEFTSAQIGGMAPPLVGVSRHNIEALKQAAGEKIHTFSDEIKAKAATHARAAALGLVSPSEAAAEIAKFIGQDRRRVMVRTPPRRGGGQFSSRRVGAAYRGEVIARTEIGRAFTAAAQAHQEEITELIPNMRKQWIAVIDGKARPSHAAMIGKKAIKHVKEPYRVGGSRMMYPLDMSAPSHEVVNCRCISVPLAPDQQRQAPVVAPPPPEPEPEPAVKPRRKRPKFFGKDQTVSLSKSPEAQRRYFVGVARGFVKRVDQVIEDHRTGKINLPQVARQYNQADMSDPAGGRKLSIRERAFEHVLAEAMEQSGGAMGAEAFRSAFTAAEGHEIPGVKGTRFCSGQQGTYNKDGSLASRRTLNKKIGLKIIRETTERLGSMISARAGNDYGLFRALARSEVSVKIRPRWSVSSIRKKGLSYWRTTHNRGFYADERWGQQFKSTMWTTSQTTNIHEAGHFVESRAEDAGGLIVYDAIQAFIKRRTTGPDGRRDQLKRLIDLYPDSNYKPHEVTRENKFVDAYIGRDYHKEGSSEGFTMGLERMTPERFTKFYNNDPEHFGLILSLISGRVKR